MATVRQPFQGVLNIIWFNWPFYVVGFGVALLLLVLAKWLSTIPLVVATIICVPIFLSLAISFYVYDRSALYDFPWLEHLQIDGKGTIVNIHAGYDETSQILQQKFPKTELIVLDFFDPLRHTEPSIRRARSAYPPFPNTKQAKPECLPLPDYSAHAIFVIFAAHEIRNDEERGIFFKELNRVLIKSGRIIVVEHLRDVTNCLAYNIGALHFHSRIKWLRTFSTASLLIEMEFKTTPFVSTFILKKNGTSS